VSLNPRSIAVQGIGRPQRLVAMQGLWPDQTQTIRPAGLRRRVPVIDRGVDEADALLLLVAGEVAGFGTLQ
jgi:hypothetical protein